MRFSHLVIIIIILFLFVFCLVLWVWLFFVFYIGNRFHILYVNCSAESKFLEESENVIPFTFRLQLSILCMTNLSERNWLQRCRLYHRLAQGIFSVQFQAARETNFPFLSCVQLLKMTSKSLFVHHTISSVFCIQLIKLIPHRALLRRLTFAFASHIIYAVITISSSLMPCAIVQLWYMVK